MFSTIAKLIGSTTKTDYSAEKRLIRCDDDGYLEVTFSGGSGDVNIAEVGGNTVVDAGVNGMLGVAGDVPDDDPASASNPLKVGGVADDEVSAVADGDQVHFVTDLYRRMRTVVDNLVTVAGDVADDAPSTSTEPVKIGAVADEVESLVADDDMVHLITDLYRRLRVVSAAFDTLTESDKVSVQNTIASDRDTSAQTIADESDAADPSYYPSSDGLEIGNRDRMNFICSIEGGDLSFEASNDGSTWVDVSKTMVDDEQGTSGYDSTHYTSASGTTTDFAVSVFALGYRYIRLKWEPSDATSTIEVTLMQRAN